MVKAGSSQRKDEIFWLVTLSRLFLSVLPKMPTFMALSGTDRMPACDWETMGYMHTLKTSKKLCKAHADQCFLNRDQDWGGWRASASSGKPVHPTPPSWESLCIIKGHNLWYWGAYPGKWLRTVIKMKVHSPHLQMNQAPKYYTTGFSYCTGHLSRPHFIPQDLPITEGFSAYVLSLM